MPFNSPGLTEEFGLCCADSFVNVLGYVLLLYGTFKELNNNAGNPLTALPVVTSDSSS